MEEYTIRILCGETMFEFPIREREDAWFSLDGAESSNGSEKLVLNADRDVYAVYTDENGEEHYGTVGDEENETLADNFSCSCDETYYFYENPMAKEYYV